MIISVSELGKRYNYNWIFRQLNFDFTPGLAYSIIGANGSGKTTLLTLLSGYSLPSEGSITYTHNDKTIESEYIYQLLSFCSPATELIEELTLHEMILFQQKMKPFIKNITAENVLAITELDKHRNKFIHSFSTGMKQRVKVALAVLADVPMVLLDEPTSNLDAAGVDWYKKMINDYYSPERLFIIASNAEHDFMAGSRKVELGVVSSKL